MDEEEDDELHAAKSSVTQENAVKAKAFVENEDRWGRKVDGRMMTGYGERGCVKVIAFDTIRARLLGS